MITHLRDEIIKINLEVHLLSATNMTTKTIIKTPKTSTQ